MAHVSELDRSMIQNLMMKRSHKQIAQELELSESVVAEVVAELTRGTDLVTRQMKLDTAMAMRPPKPPRPPKEKKERPPKPLKEKKREVSSALLTPRQRDNLGRPVEKKYQTREVDYGAAKWVRVDKKTHIMLRPGQTEQEAISNYNTFQKPKAITEE